MSRQEKKRERDFFKEDLDFVNSDGMSEICKMSRFIYDIWEEYGSEQLQFFLENELEMESGEAKLIASRYNPVAPPADFCPIRLIKKGDFTRVFEFLALQLPSRHNKDGIWPKNLLGWRVMQKIYGKEVFDFEIIGKTGESHDNRINVLEAPLAKDGNVMPFGLAALNVVSMGDIPINVLKKLKILIDELGEVGEDLIRVLIDAKVIFPPNRVLEKLISDIKAGLTGKKVIITGAFCPDYAYREINNPMRPTVKYEYTFENIGRGVGLVAKQVQRILPHLIAFFEKYNIDYQVVLGIGDFEANSPQILESVGVDYDEFLSCCKGSLDAFRCSLLEIDMDLVLFEKEFAQDRWCNYIKEASNSFEKGDFGLIKTSTGKDPCKEVRFLAKDGINFYRRWYNRPEISMEEVENLVISQAAEYAAMGRILSESFDGYPFIQLSGDRPKMQIFNNKSSTHATLCAKRIY